MNRTKVRLSAHARSRMAQRGISDRQILIIINGGHRESEPTSAVSAERWRYTGIVDGRRITVIATESETDVVVITAY